MKYKRDDLDHWARLDVAAQKSKAPSRNGKSITGAQVKRQALEWLRLESIRLAYSSSPENLLRIAKEQDHDLRHAFGRERDQLIALPSKCVTWIYPSYLREVEEAFCFEIMNPDEIHPERLKRDCRSGRIVISIDPRYSTRIIAELRNLLRGKREGKRAIGAGRTFHLLRLREALLSYQTWLGKAPVKQQPGLGPHIYSPTLARDKVVMRDIGESLRSCPAPSGKDPFRCENIAREILELAREMMMVAVSSMARSFPNKDRSANTNRTLRKNKVLQTWSRQYR